jgi:membrane-bound lytic murein transglycosylase D
MKRIFLAGLAALTSALLACAQNPTSRSPEPYEASGPDLTELGDAITEAEVRAFLAAEEEARLAEEQADAALKKGAAEEGTEAALIDQADFDLPITMNERVEFWMDYFQNRQPERFAVYLTRMGRYEEMIRAELRARGMPEDLIYLALIESGFSPSATSSAAAVGVWQFIAPTARRFRLEVSRYVDERRDPVKATSAALDYLQALYDRFGSWYLAAAGYNTGENRVERILRERANGARGADSLYWEISGHLHSETRNYVPKMIAATILGKYRDRYGFEGVVPHDADAFEIVTVPDATELGVIARAAGVEPAQIEALNPHFLRGVTPPGRKVEVRIPVGRSDAFQVAYAQIPPAQRVTRLEHVVAKGETLSHIARRYGVTVAAIQETNGLKNAHSIRVGRRLVIAYGKANTTGAAPRATATTPARGQAARHSSAASAAAEPRSTGRTRATLYRVRPGDSLWSIAQRHGVSIGDLQTWNKLGRSSKIIPGQELKVSAAGETTVYRIQPGDTIWGIARRHGITADQLMQWNSIAAGATIRPGEELEVPVIR